MTIANTDVTGRQAGTKDCEWGEGGSCVEHTAATQDAASRGWRCFEEPVLEIRATDIQGWISEIRVLIFFVIRIMGLRSSLMAG